MKKNVIFVCLLLSLFSNVHALNDRFLTYCKSTNHAELNIMDNKLQEALSCYAAAFSLYPQPLAKDIHNAIVCAKKIGDEQKIKKYLRLMIATKNLNPKYYSQERLLKYLSKEEKESIQKKYTDKIKSEDYQFIQKLIQEDHAIRTPENYSQRYYLINKTDSTTYEKYKAHFGDALQGEELTLNLPRELEIDWVLFRHWTSDFKVTEAHRQIISLDAIDRAIKMMEDLKLLNYHYAFYYDAKTDNSDFWGFGLVLKTVFKTKKIRKLVNNNKKVSYTLLSPETIVEIDKKRAAIGMETYQEYVRKVAFFTKNKEYCFFKGHAKRILG